MGPAQIDRPERREQVLKLLNGCSTFRKPYSRSFSDADTDFELC